jgi:hypothetical protein
MGTQQKKYVEENLIQKHYCVDLDFPGEKKLLSVIRNDRSHEMNLNTRGNQWKFHL